MKAKSQENIEMKNPVILLALFVAILMGTRGCGRYGEVSQLTFEHAKALYGACNSRRHDRLAACATMVSEAESSHQISASEARYLRDIIAIGNAEEWEDAQAMARQLMTDQADL